MHANNGSSPSRTIWDRRKSVSSLGNRWLTALLLVPLTILPASAQYRASLQGTVVDPQGAMIPGAQMTLTDQETNRIRTTTSDRPATSTSTNFLPARTRWLHPRRIQEQSSGQCKLSPNRRTRLTW